MTPNSFLFSFEHPDTVAVICSAENFLYFLFHGLNFLCQGLMKGFYFLFIVIFLVCLGLGAWWFS